MLQHSTGRFPVAIKLTLEVQLADDSSSIQQKRVFTLELDEMLSFVVNEHPMKLSSECLRLFEFGTTT